MSDALTETRAEVTRLKTIRNFDATHPGGVDGLMKKVEATPPPTLKELSNEYGRTVQRMAVIVATLLDMPYSKYLARRRVVRQRVNHKEE